MLTLPSLFRRRQSLDDLYAELLADEIKFRKRQMVFKSLIECLPVIAPPNTMLCGSADSPASAAKPSATQAESAAANVRRELP